MFVIRSTKPSSVGFSSNSRGELGAADPFGHARGDDDRAAVLDDRHRADHSFDRLIERRVERIAGAARDDDVDLLSAPSTTTPRTNSTPCFERGDHVAGDELERPALRRRSPR